MTPKTESTKPLAPMIGEITQEAATTRRLLERVPTDKLGWKPHPRSMSLGQLAMHVATIPGGITRIAAADTFEINPADMTPPIPNSTEEILAALDASIQSAKEYVAGVSESGAASMWRATMQGRELMAMPRVAMLRTLLLNHWYHHRGQLSVYLRLLDIPLPSIYGPSADENPFG
jgi:uncharacterized damage-inducible protein DinB